MQKQIMDELNLTDEMIDEYLSVALSNADRVGPGARHKLKGILRYYAKKQHPFTACVNDNRKRFGNRAEAVCAVLKDIIRGTTHWRGHNNPMDHGAPGLATALSEKEKAFFTLDIPEDVQDYLDEIDDEYVEALMAQVDTNWIDSKTSVNGIKGQLEMVLNAEDPADAAEDKADDGMDELDKGESYGYEYWVVDLDAEMDDAYVCYKGTQYFDVPFSVDSDGDVKVSDKSKWTELEQKVIAKLSQDPQMLAEMFFDGSGEATIVGDDGLIYKTLLREGEWKYSPGPGQVPINKPINVIKTGSSDGRARTISMEEIKSNFDNNIVEHVTIPKTHDDKVDENTGYIRNVRIGEDETGRAILEAGFDFTEPDIKEKVQRGTIANTSAGVLFDYIHKESGKKFNAVLAHAALTNHPWLNGMKPFGIEASDDLEVVSFSEENYPNTGGEVMPEATKEKNDEVVETPEDSLATKLGLSEDEITSRLAEYEALKAKDKNHEVESQITEWQNEGVTPAVLSEAKAILMADEGAVVLNLSEDGKAKPFTATQLVTRLIGSMPKVDLSDEPGKGEQGATEADNPVTEETDEYADLSLSERAEIANLAMFGRVSEEDAIAQVRANREKK